MWSAAPAFKESAFLTSGGAGKGVSNLFYGSLETAMGDGRLRANIGINRSKPDWYTLPGSGLGTTRNGGPGTMSERPSRMLYADAQYTFSPSSQHVVVVGASLRADKAETTDYDLSDWRSEKAKDKVTRTSSGKTRAIGLFVQDEITVTDQLTASLGLRWDHWRTSDGEIDEDGVGSKLPQRFAARSHSAWSPKLGLRYRINDRVALRSSLGKAFRAPNVYELYRNWSSGTTVYRPNPNLKPETGISWDIGADFRPWQGAEVKTTFFYNRLKNMIYRQRVGAGVLNVQEYLNVGRGRSYGLELDLRQQIGNDWTLLANAAYNNTRIQKHANPELVGKKFMYVPKYTANLGVEWKHGNWEASGWLRHASKRYTFDDNSDVVSGVPGSQDRYTLVDLKAGYQINKNLKASVSVDNLFNKKYYGGTYRAPGRSYFVELTGTF